MHELIFGFDIGTTSIGWAVICYDRERETGEIVRKDGVPGMGVRIFPEARDPDGTPLNQTRRQKRMMRRQLRRRKHRRRLLNETLANAGLLPAFGKDKDSDWAKLMTLDPYPLRVKGLTEQLLTPEFGRAIYHLSKLRHFKGRDLEDDAPDAGAPHEPIDAQEAQEKFDKILAAKAASAAKGAADDEKKLKEEIEATHQVLRARGITLGQFLLERNSDARNGAPPQQKRREVHAHRVDVEAEFEALWGAQAKHHAILGDAAFKASVQDAIFAQRPVFWRRNTLGTCRFMPDEQLCPRGSWLSQQKRMLEKLNNLAIVGGNARPLYPEERAAILSKLQTQGSMSWSGVRTALKPIFKERGEAGAEKSLKFNLELDEGGTLLGNPLESKLAAVFGDAWESHPRKQAIRDAVHERLWQADYDEVGTQRVVIRASADRKGRRKSAAQSFIDEFGATPAQAAKLRELKLSTGWEPFSTTALTKLLPELERGERFGALTNSTEKKYIDWRNSNFPDRERPTGEFVDSLPSPAKKEEQDRIKAIRNPTVVRTQNELRKVVNNLIRVYGKPDLIRIELTRDVGKSKREREENSKRNRKNERERKRAADDLKSKGIPDPSREDVEKWALWQECDRFDLYSGLPIDFDGLFRGNVFQVEHIWPRATSLDNSFANKTLCHRDWNAKKANRTPFAAFETEPTWDAMKKRVWDRVEARTMSRGKAKRFCREEPLPEDFTSRQLNDTGYAARQAVAFLKRLWPDIGPDAPVTVQPVSGKVTAQLRKYWELNNILSDSGEKTRADHRHHAIDALAVACAHPGVTQRLSTYLQQKDDPRAPERPKLPEPWPNIRADAEKAVADIVVSHRVRKKVSGPLHKESVYGDTGVDAKSSGIRYRQLVQRVPITALGADDIAATDISASKFKIRDDAAASAIRAKVAEHGGDLKKALAAPIPIGSEAPSLMRKVRLVLKRQLDGMQENHNGYVDPESKHHMAFYEGEPAIPVTLYEAFRRKRRKEPVIRKIGPGGGLLMMTLSKGECVSFEDERSAYWIVRELKANGQVTLVPHIEARPTKQAVKYQPTAAGLIELTPKKFSIDPIGRVRPARD